MVTETTDRGNETEEISAATFQGLREAQLKSWLKATPTQRLVWLEEAVQLALESDAIPPSNNVGPEPTKKTPKHPS
jgi:hypothetical protein